MLFQADAKAEALRGLGLTEYQARAYVALCRLGRATASQVARAAGLPRNKLYHTVEELGSLGLAELRLGDVQTFAALPIAGFLKERARMHEDALLRLEAQRPDLETMFEPRPPAAERPLLECRVVQGRAAAQAQLARTVEAAQHSLVVLAGEAAAQQLAHGPLGRALAEKAREGVQVRVVVPFTPAAQAAARELDALLPGAVRAADPAAEDGLAVVADERHAAHLAEAGPGGDDVCLASDSAVLGRMLAHAGGSVWALAHPVPAEGAALPGFARPTLSYGDLRPEAERALAGAAERVEACLGAHVAPTAGRDFAGAVRDAVARGVRVRLLAGPPSGHGAALAALAALAAAGAEVRVLDLPPAVGYAVFDRRAALLAVAPPAFRGRAWEPFAGLVVRDAATAAGMAAAFDRSWDAAAPWVPAPASAPAAEAR